MTSRPGARPPTGGGGEAAYRTLARNLRSAILKGDYANGTRLPTEAELAEQYGLSRQTVRRAFHDLVSEGMVYRVPGRGTFVATRDGRYLRHFGSIDDLMGLSLDTQMEIMQPLRRQVDIQAASRLRLAGDTVYTVIYRRLHDGLPLCHTTVHLAPSIGRELSDLPELSQVGALSDSTVLELVDARLSDPIIEAEQSVTASAATSALGQALDCADGAPLLLIDRMYITSDHSYVELAVSYFLPERYSYRVNLRRHVP